MTVIRFENAFQVLEAWEKGLITTAEAREILGLTPTVTVTPSTIGNYAK